MLYDLFISHASEDKSPLVRPLARRLVEAHLTVWYDEYELRLGDSLRQTIDRGLSESRFGVVVLSEAFFAKNWPQYELDGLVLRENVEGSKVLLPIWHGVDVHAIARYSPTLAGRFAVATDQGLDQVVNAIVGAIRPKASPLIVARDELIARGHTPPIVTDEYWLDVVEASNRVPATGAMIPEESSWGRWSFPLPVLDGTPDVRGIRLAWTALQLAWISDADANNIDLTTEPVLVHEFLSRHPALIEVCHEFPDLLAEYAPQLTIPGFGGSFEADFEVRYQRSLDTPVVGKRHEACAEQWMLRHPTLGGYSAHAVAYHWFSGGMFGPPVRLHDDADHVFWLLSTASTWVPERIHKALTSGIAEMWSSWMWSHTWKDGERDESWEHRGALGEAFARALETGTPDVTWTDEVIADVIRRAAAAARVLKLPESADELLHAFREARVTQHALASSRQRRSRVSSG